MTANATPHNESDSGSVSAFDRIVAPMTRETFLSEYWSKLFVHVPGAADRFADIFSWAELNFILEEKYFDLSRLKLVREGKAVDAERFTVVHINTRHLKPASLVNCLSEGATLIMDSIHEHAPGVREIAVACEEALSAPTTVNLYGGWRTQKGFDLHWDSQDTMILQVSGRKHWKVYRPTREHPLSTDVEKPKKPTEPPIWDAVLEQGDMLYLPRGWWHVAFPLNEPSLHLTVTMLPATGVTLMEWLVTELKKHPEARRNVPMASAVSEQSAYVSEIRRLILERLDDDFLKNFAAEWEACLPVQTKIRLPDSPGEFRAAIAMDTLIRLAANRRLSFLKGLEESVSFHANGVAWNCSAGFVPALELLVNTTTCSVESLCAQLATPQAPARFIAFLTALAMGGVIWTERPGKLSK